MKNSIKPKKQGLYLPQCEHDSCGIGFVANIRGGKSHEIVEDALKILIKMEHRGATGAEGNSGDGAGILTQMPHVFLRRECEKLHIILPEPKNYAVGMVFLPTDDANRAFCERTLERIIGEEGQKFLGWRDVPFDARTLGATAANSQPFIRQIFIGKGENINDDGQF